MTLSDFFTECKENKYIAALFDIPVSSIDMGDSGRRMTMHILPGRYIPRQELHNAEVAIREKYDLSAVRLEPVFAPELFDAAVAEDLITEMRRRVATVNGSFTGCRWEYDKDKATVTANLAIDCRPLLRAQKFEQAMSDLIFAEFGTRINVALEYDEANSLDIAGVRRDIAAEDERRRELIAMADVPWADEPVDISVVMEARRALDEEQRQRKAERDKKLREREESRKARQEDAVREDVSVSSVIYGKPSNVPMMRMEKLSQEYYKVAVWGKIFNYEIHNVKSGEWVIVTFYLTDLTSSCSVKLMLKKKDEEIASKLKDGMYVTVHGTFAFDSYAKENILRAQYIALADVPRRTDDAPEKRVELHMHTNMSRMDAVSKVEDIVKRAADWGHKAIAITDHGVVQAFPGAMNAAHDCKSNGKPIKVLYGVEAYFVNDMLDVMRGECEMPMSGRFVVFDLETTGFSPVTERITEIGAVIIENGEITDTYAAYVDPQMPIPAKITQLTGISSDTVKGAPTEDIAVPDFLNWAGKDAVFVAHNASFDMGFINAACERLGMTCDNAYIDTLALSRTLYPELTHHKLDNIVEHLGLPEFDHHRAKDDAAALAGIFKKQLDEMENNFGVEKVSEINYKLKASDNKKLPRYHMIILARNAQGLKNLYRLISSSHINHFYKSPRILKSELVKLREGLIIGSACEAGELFEAVRTGRRWAELCDIARFYDYLEIQPICNNEFMLRRGMVSDIATLQKFNQTIVRLGEKLGRPVVATCDAHYLDPENDVFRRVLLTELGMNDSNTPAKLYLRTTDEMLAEFEYLGAKKAHEVVITNPNLIADMIEDIEPVPAGTYPPHIEGSDDLLRDITRAKAREIYGDPIPDYVSERLERELNSIISNGYSIMYIIAQKLVADSVEHGYLVGSRGSVGSSFVATMAGISEVNPLVPHYVCPNCKNSEFIHDGSYGSGFDLPEKNCPKCGTKYNSDGHDIPFETFLGFNGDKQPDIDLNFSDEYQNSSHRYTETLFGKDHVFKAGTISTVADKTAYRYVMKYNEKYDLNLPNAEIMRLKLGCTGVRSSTGQHPGGMVVVPGENDVYDFCPINHPANKSESGILTTHFDFHSIHDTILKLDLLGHVCPTICKYLEEYTGISVLSVPMNDKKVMSLFESPEALGVTAEDIDSQTGTFALPELGTNFVRQMLLNTHPKTFSDLLQVSGLSHGTDVYLGNADELIKNGTCTISEVIGTRDNIMLYLIGKGMDKAEAFKIMEIVRKGGASKGKLKEEMVQHMREHDVPEWYIDSCYKIKYMFPKAHAAAYMISALRIGWYKVYYPVAFYAAIFTARCESFDAVAAVGGLSKARAAIAEIKDKGNDASMTEEGVLSMLQVIVEAQARGIKFLPVDLYQSDAKHFLPVGDDSLLLPFVALKGLGEAAAESLMEAGKKGKYISRSEITERSGVGKGIIEILAAAGALDGMPESSQLNLLESIAEPESASSDDDGADNDPEGGNSGGAAFDIFGDGGADYDYGSADYDEY